VSDARDPQDLGRVRVRFPWLSDDYVSDWARTVQAGAGKGRGAGVVPEVGDEVLVAFEQGDLRRPYVLGGLHNGVDKPPPGDVPVVDGGSGAVNRRSTVSRRGHRIDLFDQQGRKDGVTVRTGDGKVSVALDSTATTLTLHSDGTVVVEAKRGVTVDAGAGTISFKGAQIELKASAQLTLDGGATCTVKGGIVRIN
jgi:uncharacterized protein involved in type VI secretion and phage assembly